MTVTRIGTRAPATPLVALVTAGGVTGVLIGCAMTAAAATPGLVEPATAVVVGLPLARMVITLAGLTTFGLALLPFLIGNGHGRDAEDVVTAGKRAAVLTSATWSLAALACLVLEVATIHVGHPIDADLVLGYIGMFRTGTALALVAAGAAVNLVIAAIGIRRPRSMPPVAPVVAAVLTLLPLPPSGHSIEAPQAVLIVGVLFLESHVLAATAWTGGLLAVVVLLGRRRDLLADALPRFSRLATVCVFLTAITGTVSAWLHLFVTPGVIWYSALFTTEYGLVLVCKVVCLVAIGLFGAHIRFRLLPAIRERHRTALVGWVALELSVMGLAFGFAAVLTQSPVIGT
jgi:putative copper resistance protein D